MLETIVRPKTVTKWEDILPAQEDWLKKVREYHDQVGTTLPEDVLIVGYYSLLPAKLVEDMFILPKDLGTFSEVKAYVERQVDVRRPEGHVSLSISAVEHESREYIGKREWPSGAGTPGSRFGGQR